jgi:hypothetical protein
MPEPTRRSLSEWWSQRLSPLEKLVSIAAGVVTLLGFIGIAGLRSPGAGPSPPPFNPGPIATPQLITQQPPSTVTPPPPTSAAVVPTASNVPVSASYVADWSAGVTGWSVTPDWAVVGTTLQTNGSGAPGEAQPDWSPSSPDYAVTSRIELLDSNSCFAFGLGARLSNDGGFTSLIGNTGPSGLDVCIDSFVEVWDGQHESQRVPYTPTRGLHVYQLIVLGDTITVRIDESTKLVTRDALHGAAGRVGIWSAGAQLAVDAFRVDVK